MKLWGDVLGMKRMMTDAFGQNSYIINEVTKWPKDDPKIVLFRDFFIFFSFIMIVLKVKADTTQCKDQILSYVVSCGIDVVSIDMHRGF